MIGRRWAAIALLAAAVGDAPTLAQVAPGVRLPVDVAEGVQMAQIFGCVAAASGRLADGLNMPLRDDLKAVAMHQALPAALANKVGALGVNSRIMSLESPQGITWMVFDPDTTICTVTALAPEPSKVREKLGLVFDSPWKRIADDAGLMTYEWSVRATPALGTPAVTMRATLDIPPEAGGQVVIVTRGVKTD